MPKKYRISNLLVLRRAHSKMGEIITWHVLTADESIWIGVIRKVNDSWAARQVGRLSYRQHFWIGTIFNKYRAVAGNTRQEVVSRMLSHIPIEALEQYGTKSNTKKDL